LNAGIASYSFHHAAPEDALRLFMIDLIWGNGPFEEKRDWVEMQGSRGEVVRCLAGRGDWDKCDDREPTGWRTRGGILKTRGRDWGIAAGEG
jgi:hypothetical protein